MIHNMNTDSRSSSQVLQQEQMKLSAERKAARLAEGN
jgi:hypothetical protein